jgi:hypothetical protein
MCEVVKLEHHYSTCNTAPEFLGLNTSAVCVMSGMNMPRAVLKKLSPPVIKGPKRDDRASFRGADLISRTLSTKTTAWAISERITANDDVAWCGTLAISFLSEAYNEQDAKLFLIGQAQHDLRRTSHCRSR